MRRLAWLSWMNPGRWIDLLARVSNGSSAGGSSHYESDGDSLPMGVGTQRCSWHLLKNAHMLLEKRRPDGKQAERTSHRMGEVR